MHENTARVSRLIHAQPREVWSALTNPSRMKAFYFGSDVETDWSVGAPITFRGVVNGRDYEDVGEILSFEPDEKLSYTHWSSLSGNPHTPEHESTVCFELQAEGENTVVTITQSRRTDSGAPPDADERDHAAQTWNALLKALAGAVEPTTPVPPYVELGGGG